MLVAELDNLLPRHSLQTPSLLVLFALIALGLMFGGWRAIHGIASSILAAEVCGEDQRHDAAHCAEREGRGMTRFVAEEILAATLDREKDTHPGASLPR